ncbi:MAG: ABC transporter ATP-binding protein, partial [Bacillota bacterium]
LISSHILPELGEICDRVAIMENGRVVVAGTVEEVTGAGGGARLILVEVPGRAGDLARFLSARDKVALAEVEEHQVRVLFRGSRDEQGALLKEIIDGGFSVVEFHEVRKNLEEAFMAVTGEVNGQ